MTKREAVSAALMGSSGGVFANFLTSSELPGAIIYLCVSIALAAVALTVGRKPTSGDTSDATSRTDGTV